MSLLGIATGCGTLGGMRQRYKLASVPDDAIVLDEDGDAVGVTNGFGHLWRGYAEELTFVRDTEVEVVEVESSYRWWESFASNLAWGVIHPLGIPVGWAIDFATGAAWQYDPVEPVRFVAGGLAGARDVVPPRILVAPPAHELELLSDEVARRLADHAAQRWPAARLSRVDEVGGTLLEYGWTSTERTPDAFVDRLYDELGVDRVLESEIVEQGDQVVAYWRLQNVFTGETEEAGELTLARAELAVEQLGWLGRWLASAVAWVPNTATLDIATPTALVAATVSDGTYSGSEQFKQDWLTVLSGVGLRSLRSSRIRGDFDAVAHLQTSVGFHWREMRFAPEGVTMEPPAKASFDWFKLTVGLAPEVGLETLIGYFYLSAIPQWGVHLVDGGFAGQRARRSWTWAFEVEAEVGYLIFVTRSVNLRLFARAGLPPEKIWRRPFTALGDERIRVADQGVATLVAGFSVGYFFPEVAAWSRQLWR